MVTTNCNIVYDYQDSGVVGVVLDTIHNIEESSKKNHQMSLGSKVEKQANDVSANDVSANDVSANDVSANDASTTLVPHIDVSNMNTLGISSKAERLSTEVSTDDASEMATMSGNPTTRSLRKNSSDDDILSKPENTSDDEYTDT